MIFVIGLFFNVVLLGGVFYYYCREIMCKEYYFYFEFGIVFLFYFKCYVRFLVNL